MTAPDTEPANATANRPLKAANDNPWYCLATLHGEQPAGGFDASLANKNCQEWSRWPSARGDGRQQELIDAFQRRTKGKLALPDPAAEPDFSFTHFDREVSFENFRFQGPVSFESAKFSDKVKFRHANFSEVDFRHATFLAEVDFAGMSVNGAADFRRASFLDDADFEAASFQTGDFRAVAFTDVDFKSSAFHGVATFTMVRFSGFAEFNSAKFFSNVNFVKATFSKSAVFTSATFSHKVNFSGATFSSTAVFVNATFLANAIFAGARLTTWVPDFRGANMHQATEWHGVAWPPPSPRRSIAQQQVYAYERLKQEMEQTKKHEDEHMFFRKELRSRRSLFRVLSGSWLLNAVYQATSDYGNSILRPLLWLTCVFVIGTAILTRLPAPASHCSSTMSVELAAKISFANIFVIFPDKREIMTPDLLSCWSNTARVVSGLQSLSGVVLLFLLGLALRNRFRMK